MKYLQVLSNLMSKYGIILVVMIANPIIYCFCCKEINQRLFGTGQYTNRERSILYAFRVKFMLINIIFYICWLPNLANGLVYWKMASRNHHLLNITRYLMDTMNPLQAFMNMLVYRKWSNSFCFWVEARRTPIIVYSLRMENTPLLGR